MKSEHDIHILIERIRSHLPEERLADRRMFGGLTLMLDGNMLCCASKSGVMFRVGKDAEAEALSRPYAQPCLGTGRPMAGFIVVEAEGLDTEAALAEWVTLARGYVEALAPKPTPGKPRGRGSAKAARGSM